jgi:hypothetical protein
VPVAIKPSVSLQAQNRFNNHILFLLDFEPIVQLYPCVECRFEMRM